MDEVEVVLGVCPRQIQVLDFEGAVWGHEKRLDGREVGADYVRRRVGVGHFACGVSGENFLSRDRVWGFNIHCPDSRTSAYIEYVVWIVNRRKVKFAFECHQIHMMCQILEVV